MKFRLLALLPFFLFFHTAPVHGDDSVCSLFEALEIAQYWDQRLSEQFPLTFNHLLATGYFVTHSARMGEDGEIGIGAAYAPPYAHINGRLQPFKHLELTANYRIFRGVEDQVLSKYGFGDYADRGANFKLALITPEDSQYQLPGLAFGIDDFIGTKKFLTYYVVATQVFPNRNLEISGGWGTGRYHRGPSRGFFGGFNWFPWWRRECKWIKGIGFSAEFDPTNYYSEHLEPHPDARCSRFPVNFGVKYNLGRFLEFSGSYIRGKEFACSGSFRYNIGQTDGFLTKIKDPVPYVAPVDTEPLGCHRPEDVMIQSLNYTLGEQGFQLTEAWIEERFCGRCLWISLLNCRYRQEHIVRMRLQNILASLLPSNVDEVLVIIESYGLPCQQYVYSRELLLRYMTHCIGPYEFDILTPREEVSCPNPCNSHRIFKRRYELWKGRIAPRLETFFGSAKGKFKYDLGLKANVEGFLPLNVFYEVQVSYTAYSTINDVSDFDMFHPSQLLNVATDYVRYRQMRFFSWDKIYLQKSWNLSRGFFARAALGYFQVNYAGLAGELLWYPADAFFAIGLEAATVRKRSYTGLGFQSKIRQFEGYVPTYQSYFLLSQYFLDFYFDFPQFHIFTKFSVGQFLARDVGIRAEATRYFDNGLRLTGWMTLTNAGDVMHGDNYFDRGISLEIPFDLFFRCSSRRVWNSAMASWLRDAGYMTTTGIPLFETINRERRF